MNKMNVTSLLNTGAAAAGILTNDQSAAPADDTMVGMYPQDQIQQQQRMDVARATLPLRSNRTPWDADGYSLPNLSHNLKDNQQPSVRPFNNATDATDSSNIISPKSSPKYHRFSDSRGSMSSTHTSMSSGNSCHSRISSLSTVSEYQPLSAYGSECTVTEQQRRLSGQQHENIASCPTVVEIPPMSPRDGGSEHDEGMGSDDCGRSPSDAVTMRNRLGGSASPSDLKIGTYLQPDSPSSISTRAHKRTVSAPAFPSLNNLNRTSRYSSFGPMAEPTPPKSPQDETIQHSSINEETNGDDSTDQSVQQPPEPDAPVCMFVQPCTTGSTLRKAISHIFGRNKLCTKSIPAHIWVHYCRKHYQRTRYRNVHEYAMLQVTLVMQQVTKVQNWSDDNVKYNRRGDGVLRHWTLQARKREAKRLQDTESRKRRYAEEEEDEEDGGNGTAIPSWLQPALNKNYSTPRMLEIVQQIKDHMDAGDITQIPDIEVLPEIITDGNESRPKPAARRTSNTGGHRHTKSEIFRAPMGSYNDNRFMDTKRMRSGVSSFPYSMPNLAHRPGQVMNMNQNYPYAMRPESSFAAIAETQADHSYWTGANYGTHSVLPQPIQPPPARSQENLNIQQPYAPQSRPSMHARSMSEVPGMRNNGFPPNEFRFSTQGVSSYGNQQQQPQDMFPNNMAMSPHPPQYGYQPPTQGMYGMAPRPDSQEGVYNNAFYPQQQDWAVSRGQHSRIQSTPPIQQHHSSIPGGPPPMPAVSGPQGLPSMHQMGVHQQQMYATSQQGYSDFQQSRF